MIDWRKSYVVCIHVAIDARRAEHVRGPRCCCEECYQIDGGMLPRFLFDEELHRWEGQPGRGLTIGRPSISPARLRADLAEVVEFARAQGWEGEAEDYTYTPEDLDEITEALGCRPTREEWKAAGLKGVEAAHVCDCSTCRRREEEARS
jgi:hypothetical protein